MKCNDPEVTDLVSEIAIDIYNQDPSVDNYESVVNTCRSCHEYMCPGPLEMINTLDLN